MVEGRLGLPRLEVDAFSQGVSQARTPFFCNDGGRTPHLPEFPAGGVPPDPAIPSVTVEGCIDLHNNRHSPRACSGHITHDSVTTDMLRLAMGNYFHWQWNAEETTQDSPAGIPRL